MDSSAVPLVSLLAHKTYDPAATVAAMRELLAPLGGMAAFVRPGQRVLLKPNLVYGRHPDKAINTHPEIVRAVAALAWDAGAGEVLIGDSPGFGSGWAALRSARILDVAEEMGLKVVEFTPVENVDINRSFVSLYLAREVLEADVVINLPKMKTHGQMLMTLAVKNMFGAVPGSRKLQWHYRAGRDRALFARAINEIAMAVRPHLNILDAVVGMDGSGPTSGRPRSVGFLAAGGDAWAVDAAVMDILGIERSLLFTLADAAENGPRAWMDAIVTGAAPSSLRPDDWRMPDMRSLQMHGGFIDKNLPWLATWLRNRISPRPRPGKACIACGYCVEICPADAMQMNDGVVTIDDSACIRCYCCHELCQHDGMDMRRPGLLAKLLGL